jgi:dTDP-4-dehydrorhamnose reductase
MKILIVGGTGFVGSYIKTHLNKCHYIKTTSCSNNNSDLIYNVEKHELLDIIDENFDIIINNVSPNTLNFSATERNIKSVIEYCKKHSSHLIQISSFLASEANRNLNDYTFKKALSEDIIISEMNEKQYTILRFSQLMDYKGESRKTQGGLYFLAESLLKKIPVMVFSNYQECYRNYMPIELLLKIIDFTIEHNIKGLHNAYFNEFTLSLKELINILASSIPNCNYETELTINDKTGFSFQIDKSYTIFRNYIEYESINFYYRKFIKTIEL